MERSITITADDYGLTQGVTDSILSAAKAGILTQVSVLANGLAFEHAISSLENYPALRLSVHLNLTEGKSLSDPATIPHLVRPNGVFRYSSSGLLLRTILALPATRRAFAQEIEKELEAQIARVRTAVPSKTLSVDGHQHVQMVPTVFRTLCTLRVRYALASVRLSREPFFLAPPGLFLKGFVRHWGLNLLAHYNSRLAKKEGFAHNDYFLGTLLSGAMSLKAIQQGLAGVVSSQGRSVEVGLHPGSPLPGEIEKWGGDMPWYVSPWREREHALATDKKLLDLVPLFKEGRVTSRLSKVVQIARFLVSGGVAALVSLVLMYFLTDIAGWWYIVSAYVSYAVGLAISFTLQKFWTFNHYSLERTHIEVILYALNTAAGFIFDAVGLYVLVEYFGLWYMAAQFLLLLTIAVWNFFIFRFVIFAPRTA